MTCCAQRTGSPPGPWVALLMLALLGACSDPAAEHVQQELTGIKEALAAGDDSAALQLARSVLNDSSGEPIAHLGAAEACIGLERFAEAAEHAEAGLACSPESATLIADLQWAQGAARLALYLQLKAADDWRAANSSLERGTSAAGTHRADAAYALVLMQGLGDMGSDGRRDKFGRLFLQLEPDGERADKVTTLMGGEDSR
jgi:hypothetical protein